MSKPLKPQKEPFSGQAPGQDITQPFIDKIVTNQDRVLTQRGAGNLDIYNELLTDDQVQSTFQQRRLAVVSREWSVIPASDDKADQDVAEWTREMLDRIDFDDVTDKMLFSVFYGHGVAELIPEVVDGKISLKAIKVRRRERFRYGANGEIYLVTMSNPRGELLEREYFWKISTGATHHDAPYGLGLAHYLYWPVFFKRNGLKFWLKFLEKFGTPTVTAKAGANITEDATKKAALLSALRSIQQDAAAIIPEGVELVLLEATKGGAADFEALEKKMDGAIAKVVLSQTMTTDAAGGQYKAEVHKAVRDEVVKADADLVCESFNRDVLPTLIRQNFGDKVGIPKVWRNTEPEEDINARAERDEKIWSMGFEPTEEYIEETYGEGWVKKQPIAMPLPGVPVEEFAELGNRINAAKMDNRNDQEAIAVAARQFANQYESLLGARIKEILAYLDDSDDLVTFREKLEDLMAQAPPEEFVESMEKATFTARLMGLFRRQPSADAGV